VKTNQKSTQDLPKLFTANPKTVYQVNNTDIAQKIQIPASETEMLNKTLLRRQHKIFTHHGAHSHTKAKKKHKK
jgi:hypothetical protein